MTPTGRKATEKVTDLRLKKQIIGTMTKPKTVIQGPPRASAQEWNPPAWLVQTLMESGDAHLVDEPPEIPQASTSSSSTDFSGMVDSRPNTMTRPRSGTDEMSPTQAVDEY